MPRPPNTLHPAKMKGAENRQKAYSMRLEGYKWFEITEACSYKNDRVTRETVRQVIMALRETNGIEFREHLLGMFSGFEVDLSDLQERYDHAIDWKQQNDIFRLMVIVKDRMIAIAQLLHKDIAPPANVIAIIERPNVTPRDRSIEVEGKDVPLDAQSDVS